MQRHQSLHYTMNDELCQWNRKAVGGSAACGNRQIPRSESHGASPPEAALQEAAASAKKKAETAATRARELQKIAEAAMLQLDSYPLEPYL